MAKLYAITHTEATHHVERRVGGWYDSELTQSGHEHAERIAEALLARLDDPPHLYSSDLKRAEQTANPIADAFNTTARLDGDLREVGCGVAEGKASGWLDERIVFPPRDGERLDHKICEGAETRRTAATRIYRFMDRLLAAEHDSAIVVTHGFAVTFVISAWLGIPIEGLGHIVYRADPGSITTLDLDIRWGSRRLVNLNEAV
ncbi:MAG: histidine phosphatase family protein [Acidobacteriota bacterium]